MLDLHLAPFLTAEGLIALVSLTALEIVLGIDNIVFIAIVSERIDPARRSLLRRSGLGLALFLRIGLLFGLSLIMGLSRPVLTLLGQELSGRDLVLLAGGLFLIAKASNELFRGAEPPDGRAAAAGSAGAARDGPEPGGPRRFATLLAQILVLDIVFSLDSVITAVGMARQIPIMVAAMIIAVGVMVLAANLISELIGRHPSLKVLALSFLLLVGVLLVADAFDRHIPKGYVYFAMAYALGVELINIRRRRASTRKPAAEP